jgi:hypothetical protein
MFCSRLFPGQYISLAPIFEEGALATTLAGGVGNGYFA